MYRYYDPNLPDFTTRERKFNEIMLSKAMDPGIFVKYKRDQRETLEQSVLKSESYRLE